MNFYKVSLLLFCALLIELSNSASLPTFIKRCIQSDFDKCVADQFDNVRDNFFNGYKKLNIPTFNPLHLDSVLFGAVNGLEINFYNLSIYGFDTLTLLNSKTSFEHNTVEGKFKLKKIEYDGIYDAKGQVLILPIKGHGRVDCQGADFDVDYNFGWNIIEKSGVEYMNLTRGNIDFKVGKFKCNLQNLFDGNKRLGDEMNNFINENSLVLIEDFKPSLLEILLNIIHPLLQRLTSKISLENLLGS